MPHAIPATGVPSQAKTCVMQKAGESTHRFESAAALKAQLLYNHVPSHNETQTGGYFYEVYVFPFSPRSADSSAG